MSRVQFTEPLEQKPLEQSRTKSMKAFRSILKPTPPKLTRSQRAGTLFSVKQVHQRLESTMYNFIEEDASVYLAAVLEYLVAELVDVSSIVAKNENQVNIQKTHLQRALNDDEELRDLIAGPAFESSADDTRSFQSDSMDCSY